MQEKKSDYAEYIRNKITQLRIKKNISEYQLSYDLGKSKGYIQSISSKKALPSMEAFLDICDYFEITPEDFFNESNQYSKKIDEMCNMMSVMSENDIDILMTLAHRLTEDQPIKE